MTDQQGAAVPLNVLQPGYTALLLTGVMLPVAGAISALVSIASAGIPGASRLAVTVPIAELTAAGAYPVGLVLFGLLFAWVLARVFPARTRAQVVATLIGGVLGSAIGFVIGGALISIPFAASAVAFTALVFILGRFERYRPVRGRPLAFVLVAMYLLAAFATGLQAGPSAALIVNAPAAPVGYALRVGEDADWLYLAPCAQRGRIMQIPKASILSIEWAPSVQHPDFLTRLTHAPGLRSFYDACP